MAKYPTELLEKAKGVQLFVTDVDGCWTDGRISVHADGSELVHFDVQDGYGMVLLQKAGVEIAIISGRENPAVVARAERLGVQTRFMGSFDKAPLLEQLMNERGLQPEQVAVIGDDLPDLDMFQGAGLCFAPQNAVSAVQESADWVTPSTGGRGALRDCCDLLLAAISATTNGEAG